ncbi:unnamed protein product [Vitrella brassicaformis CCMP3155]|uniref:NAD(P)-binding domain-containing protein n=2 Tax=Vitrella brassicaformis TaxID=1169539 RepID=A0A0G4EQC9_VITBC|nr:unnamed protein product [Vitrella brassicaformis CCMP3155]|eukprot:CEL99835.1 unnamed protein product [Vitrella brassicaformis CCMP3155]
MAALSDGDTIVVAGATGGVGQLVTQRLAQLGRFKVRALSRSPERASGPGGPLEALAAQGVEVARGDVRDPSSLPSALADASAVVVCTGTTAFPTGKWKGGNTPKAIDEEGTRAVVEQLRKQGGLKKFALPTSIGVRRPGQLPFSILNLFGVLDAKKSGEEAVMSASKECGYDYVIVRPGRLIGGPYTNPDVATLLKIEGGDKQRVEIAPGDQMAGDCLRVSVAEAIVQALLCPALDGVSIDFSIINSKGDPPTDADWGEAMTKLETHFRAAGQTQVA